MCLPGLLIGVPFVAAILAFFLAFCLRGNGARNILVKLAAAVTMVLSVGTAIRYFGHPAFLKITGGFLPAVLLAVDVIAAAVIFYYTLIKFKKFKIAFLELIQLAGILWFEKGIGHAIEARHDLLIDNFALIMVLIAGIIGSLIAVFSLGYMEEFQKEHRDVQDRRPFFFFVIFLFLSAMFGLVISNNLLIMYTCWEITSLCSFLLIGYTQTEEAVENSFKALWMNLLGGVAFAAAILWLGAEYESVELSMLINLGCGCAAGLLRFYQSCHDAFLRLAAGSYGCANADFGFAAFVHNGKGRRVPDHQTLPRAGLEPCRSDDHVHRRSHVPVCIFCGHFPV